MIDCVLGDSFCEDCLWNVHRVVSAGKFSLRISMFPFAIPFAAYYFPYTIRALSLVLHSVQNTRMHVRGPFIEWNNPSQEQFVPREISARETSKECRRGGMVTVAFAFVYFNFLVWPFSLTLASPLSLSPTHRLFDHPPSLISCPIFISLSN